MHDHPHQYNNTGEHRISTVPASIKAYPTHHSWMITAHVSLEIMEKQWKLFTRQMVRTWQLLASLLWKPLAPTQLLSALEAELNSLNSIHTSYQPLILATTQLLKKEPSFNGVPVTNKHMRRSLLPFLGDALSWLTGTATSKYLNSIKTGINQLITTQHNQQETLVHVISILNVTRYTTQFNRELISIVMSAAEKTHQDVMTLYNITHSLYSSLSYQQVVLHIQCILANLWDSLYYDRSCHMHDGLHWCCDHRNTLTTCATCRRSQGNTITHWGNASFYHASTNFIRRYTPFLQIPTHPHLDCWWTILITDWCTNTGSTQQMEIYKVFNLDVPHGNFSACYNIHNRYLGITHDETMPMEISEDQFKTCQKAIGQFCNLNTSLLPLSTHHPPTCVSALYAKDKASIQKKCSLQIRKASSISIPISIAPNVWIITSPMAAVPSGITLICPGEAPRSVIPQTPIHILWLQPACSTTSQHFHLPPCYKSHEITVNISLKQQISMLLKYQHWNSEYGST